MPYRDAVTRPRVLVVESDLAHAATMTSALEALGLEVGTTADGTSALQLAKSMEPALIILCVELPKMSGYSICNKLKKNPELKGIPLIIMSSEATPDIFEQHKKLKTRAEDYLIKPFTVEELGVKVRQLLGAEGVESTSPGGIGSELTHEMRSATGEIPIAYADDLLTTGMPVHEIEVDDSPDEDPAGLVDGEIARETDLAFAALEMGPEDGTERSGGLQSAPTHQGMQIEEPARTLDLLEVDVADEPLLQTAVELSVPPLRRPPSMPELPVSPPIDIEVDDLDAAAAEPVKPLQPSSTRERRDEPAKPLQPSSTRERRDEPVKPPQPFATREPRRDEPVKPSLTREQREESRPRQEAASDPALQRRAQELERENRRLQEELQQALARPATSDSGLGFSRDRELLNLREIINKKEKEILDLKDDIDSKERQILDHKDKVRELERKVRDMDEKLLGVEREIVTANEKTAALQQDKEKTLERERGVKARLEDAKKEIDKAYAEVDDLKVRHKESTERLLAENEAALSAKVEEAEAQRQQHATELERLRAEHAEALQGERDQHAEALQGERDQHGGELVRLGQEHAAKLEQAEQRARQELEGAEERHRQAEASLGEQHARELQALRSSQAEETGRLRSDHERALAEERAAAEARAAEEQRHHEEAVRELQDQQAAELDRLRREQGAQVASLNERQQRELEERDARNAGDKEALRTEHRAELDRLRLEQEQALDAARQEDERATQELRAEHAAAMEQLRAEHEASEQGLRDKHAGELDRVRRENADKVAAMETRHGGEVEELRGQISDWESQAGKLTQGLQQSEESLRETRSRVNSLEIELQGAQETVAEREQTIAEREQTIAGLDQTIAGRDQTIAEQQQQARAQQDRLLAAENKIRSDEQLADKAKRAMAIAITLLEEQKKVSAEVGPAEAVASPQ